MRELLSAGRPGIDPAGAAHWIEHLRSTDLSVGTYTLPAGATDEQSPHTEDEIYVVTAGHGFLTTPTDRVEVHPGSVVFVPAGEEHRFTEIDEQLAVLVVFGPAEHSRAESGD